MVGRYYYMRKMLYCGSEQQWRCLVCFLGVALAAASREGPGGVKWNDGFCYSRVLITPECSYSVLTRGNEVSVVVSLVWLLVVLLFCRLGGCWRVDSIGGGSRGEAAHHVTSDVFSPWYRLHLLIYLTLDIVVSLWPFLSKSSTVIIESLWPWDSHGLP